MEKWRGNEKRRWKYERGRETVLKKRDMVSPAGKRDKEMVRSDPQGARGI